MYIPLNIPTCCHVVSHISAFAQTAPSLDFNSTVIYLVLFYATAIQDTGDCYTS